jgi:hypothetical protein
LPTKLTKKYLKRIREQYKTLQNDEKLPPKFRSDAVKFQLEQKKIRLEALKEEHEKMMKATSNEEETNTKGTKKVRNIQQKLDFVASKYGEVQNFQETLKYMLDRDLKSLNK